MTPHASQTRCTRPRVVITSALMVSLSINSRCIKREIALVNLFILPLHFLLLLGSSKCFLTFSLYNCFSFVISLLTLTLLRFYPLTLTWYFSAFPFDFSPPLRLFRSLLSAFELPLLPPLHSFHHAKRKGGVKERHIVLQFPLQARQTFPILIISHCFSLIWPHA